MNRIENCFQQLNKNKQTALIPYITAGFPRQKDTLPIMHLLVKYGADIIELGVPFSDPMADGTIIQQASDQAIKQGMNLKKILEIVSIFRVKNTNTPIVLMSYVNPIESYGAESFFHDAKKSGVDGVLCVDLPYEEQPYYQQLMPPELNLIQLIAPTTSKSRLNHICKQAQGFIYYVALKGVTGAKNFDINEIIVKTKLIKSITRLPLAIGFGIKNANHVQSLHGYADGIVIGSELVKQIANAKSNNAIEDVIMTYLSPIKNTLLT